MALGAKNAVSETATCPRTSSPSTKPAHSRCVQAGRFPVPTRLTQQRPRAPQVPGWDGPDTGTKPYTYGLQAIITDISTCKPPFEWPGTSKAAKKNAKRKEKRAEENSARQDDEADCTHYTPPPLPPGWAPPPPVAPPAGSREAVCQKLIMKTQKKLKQCDALVKRQEAGEVLTKEEDDKLAKMPAWCATGPCGAASHSCCCCGTTTGRMSCGSCNRTWSRCLFHDTFATSLHCITGVNLVCLATKVQLLLQARGEWRVAGVQGAAM